MSQATRASVVIKARLELVITKYYKHGANRPKRAKIVIELPIAVLRDLENL